MYKYNFRSVFWRGMVLLLFLGWSSSCVFDKENRNCFPNDDHLSVDPFKAYLSFDVADRSFVDSENVSRNGLRVVAEGNVIDNNYSTGFEEGTEAEYKISRLWVLLFEKGADVASSPLKYMFKFDAGTSIPSSYENYKDPDGLFELVHKATSGPSSYRTSVKLVDPGKYRLIILANPTTYSIANAENDQFAKQVDFFEAHKDQINPTAAPSYEKVFRMLSSDYISYQFPNGPRQSPDTSDDQPMNGIMQGPFSDKEPNDIGLPAFYVNNDFDIPQGYGSPKVPFIKGVGLERSQAKLVVTIDNLKGAGNDVETTSYDYKIKDIKLCMTDGFTLIPSTDYSLSGVRAENKLKLRPLLSRPISYKDEDGQEQQFTKPQLDLDSHFPLLKTLKEDGFTKRIDKSLLFNHYLPPYTPTQSLSSSPAYLPSVTPQLDIESVPYLYILVENKTNGKELAYKIPIYGKDQDETEIYKIKNNTVYRIHLRFHGPKIIRVRIKYTVEEFTPIDVEVPAFT